MVGLLVLAVIALPLIAGAIADRLDLPSPDRVRRSIRDDNTRILHAYVLEETIR